MKYYLTYLLFFLSSLSIGLNAQSIKEKSDLDKKSLKNYKKAVSKGREGDFKNSLKYYDKVLKKHPTFVDAQLRKAGMLFNIKDYEAARDAFDKAIAIAPEYDPEVYFSQAKVYTNLKEYDKAASHYQMYVDKSSNSAKVKKASKLKVQSDFIHHSINNPVPFEPVKLQGGINSDYSEYVPLMNIENDRMIFTRRVNGQEDFYIADRNEDQFVNARPLEVLNTHQNEGVHTLSSQGDIIIYTACDRRKTGIGSCDLFYSRLVDSTWIEPMNMGKKINTIHWDAQPSLSADGKKLFFSSNRRYGHGGKDIWLSTRTDTSGWSIPKPLSTSINTEGNEESPFIHPDGHTLYFRSNGHLGMGNYDIFFSRYIDSTDTWMAAENIGYPINTIGSEGALSVSLDGTKAYFASDMEYLDDKANANLDIYGFDLYEDARPIRSTFVKAKIIDANTQKPIEARYSIEAHDMYIDPISGIANKQGTFITSLPTNQDYALFVEAPGYAMHSNNFALKGVNTSVKPYLLEIELIPIELPSESEIVTDVKESKPIVLNNIFFESGSSDLLPTSNLEIQKLAENLATNPAVIIEIRGHTDNVGSEDDNMILSQNRAISVKNALITKGIDKNRINAKGFGESQPISDNDSEIGRSKNRRTEFVLIYK